MNHYSIVIVLLGALILAPVVLGIPPQPVRLKPYTSRDQCEEACKNHNPNLKFNGEFRCQFENYNCECGCEYK